MGGEKRWGCAPGLGSQHCRGDACPTWAQGTQRQAATALALQIVPRIPLGLGGSDVSWRQGQQPKVQSSSTVTALMTAPMTLGPTTLLPH